MRNKLDGILSKQNYNKVFAINHLLIGGKPSNDTPIVITLLSYYVQHVSHNLLQIDHVWLLPEITMYRNKVESL